MISTTKPYIFLEWYEENFRCFGSEAADLLRVAAEHDYDVAAVSGLSVIPSREILALHMCSTALFVLAPRSGADSSDSSLRGRLREHTSA
jgi:hypothetical protein